MSEITLGTVLKRADLLGTKIDDELVFFNHNTGMYFGTGPVGVEIWNFLQSPQSVDDVCTHLLEKFDVDRETCESQVSQFVAELLKEGIIETAET